MYILILSAYKFNIQVIYSWSIMLKHWGNQTEWKKLVYNNALQSQVTKWMRVSICLEKLDAIEAIVSRVPNDMYV